MFTMCGFCAQEAQKRLAGRGGWWKGRPRDAAPSGAAPPSLPRRLRRQHAGASGGPGARRGVDMGPLPAWAQQVYRGTARAGRMAARGGAHRASSAAHRKRRRRALERRRSLCESRWRERAVLAAGVGTEFTRRGRLAFWLARESADSFCYCFCILSFLLLGQYYPRLIIHGRFICRRSLKFFEIVGGFLNLRGFV